MFVCIIGLLPSNNKMFPIAKAIERARLFHFDYNFLKAKVYIMIISSDLKRYLFRRKLCLPKASTRPVVVRS
jgi:hypothetical protein